MITNTLINLIETGRFQEASIIAAQQIKNGNATLAIWVLSAEADARGGKPEDAIKTLEQAPSHVQSTLVVLLTYAKLYEQVGNLEKSEHYVRKTLAMGPLPKEVLIELGDIVARTGDVYEAKRLYTHVLISESTDKPTLGKLEEVNRRIDKTENDVNKKAKYLESSSRFPTPYISFTGKPNGTWDGGGTYDAQGFPNSQNISPWELADEYRVFVVGDSTIHDSSQSYESTVCGKLQNHLNQDAHNRVRIYNMGVKSSRLRQMLSLIIFKIADLNPDLIVVSAGATDVFFPLHYDPRPGYPYNHYIIEELYETFFSQDGGGKPKKSSIDDILSTASERLTNLRKNLSIEFFGAWENQVAEEFEKDLIKLDRIASALDLNVIACLQPLINTKTEPSPQEINLVRPETLAYFSRQYNRYKSMLAKLIANSSLKKLAVRDTTNIFDETKERVYDDFVHYNDLGKEIMARKLLELIRGHLEKP